jgi:hypothetical protein
MRKFAALLTLACASTSLAGVSFQVVPNPGASALDTVTNEHFSYDLVLTMTGGDDWTSSSISAAIAGGDMATFNPRNSAAKPAAKGSETTTTLHGAYVSTPNDVPNTSVDGSIASTLGFAGTTSWLAASLSATWFDTSANPAVYTDPDTGEPITLPPYDKFTVLRITLRQPVALDSLTLVDTGTTVATINTNTTVKSTGGTLQPFSFKVYRVPEPTTLSLLALGGLAGLIRRR